MLFFVSRQYLRVDSVAQVPTTNDNDDDVNDVT
jgi:hypothetical protein